jgi:hypothetical protein
MAPPGFAPPSYSHDEIPNRFVHKVPPPPGADTNGQAYLIVFSYLALETSLLSFIALRIVKGYHALQRSTAERPPKRRIQYFISLAFLSLLIPGYYQFRTYYVSYRTWLMWKSYYDLTPDKLHWGLWLRETPLFRNSWEILVVGNSNYWWTHQIFVFAGVLALILEQKGRQFGMRHEDSTDFARNPSRY